MQTYSEKLKDPRWQKVRNGVLERDQYTCRDCGATDKHLHVHHCFYERGGPWETPPSLLLTLCAECHDDRDCMEEVIKRQVARLLVSQTKAQVDALANELAESGHLPVVSAFRPVAARVT